MAKATTIADAKEQLKAVIGFTKQVPVFRVSDQIRSDISQIASHVENGEEARAVEAANRAIHGLHSTLNAFIRNAFVDKNQTKDGVEIAVKSHFHRLIENREVDEQYDLDIIENLKSKYNKALEQIRAETNGSFQGRVDAYLTMDEAVKAADIEQDKRDRKRAIIAANAKKAAKDAKDAEATERNRQAALTQRQRMLEGRKKAADEFRNLL